MNENTYQLSNVNCTILFPITHFYTFIYMNTNLGGQPNGIHVAKTNLWGNNLLQWDQFLISKQHSFTSN